MLFFFLSTPMKPQKCSELISQHSQSHGKTLQNMLLWCVLGDSTPTHVINMDITYVITV